jgi:hypothetical protein
MALARKLSALADLDRAVGHTGRRTVLATEPLLPVSVFHQLRWRSAMIDGDRDVVVERRVERRAGGSDLVAMIVVLGAIAAVAFGWWSVGTTPLVEKRVSQAPPSVTSPDTTVQPRTTVREGGASTL